MYLFLDDEYPHDVIRTMKGQYILRNRNKGTLAIIKGMSMRRAREMEILTSDSVICITSPPIVLIDNPVPQIRPFFEARFERDIMLAGFLQIKNGNTYDVKVCPFSVNRCSEIIDNLLR
jgi:hypothetical protein